VPIRGEHDKVEVLFVIHGLASFTPAEVNEVFKVSATTCQLLRVHTIFGVEVDVARRGIRRDFVRLG
jgi:hypothetical protein